MNISQYINAGKITVEGIIAETPVSQTDRKILIINCLRILKDKSYLPVSGKIRLTIPADSIFQYGDFVRFHSTVKKIYRFNNPGSYDYERLLSLRGIYAAGFIEDNSGIVLLRKDAASKMKLKLESFRAYLKEIILNNASSPQREIIGAMTLGSKHEIPLEVRDNFNKTGTSHILAISGLHIGMVAATSFFFFFLLFKLSERMMLRFNIIKLASTAAFMMVLLYAFIAGMGITVTRAAIMAFVFLIALLSGRQKDMYNTLALAGIIILIISPEAIFDVSFQFSFLSVLAIIFIARRFDEIPLKNFPFLPLWSQKVIRYIYWTIIICAAATIGTLPLMMYYFNRVSLISILANMIVVPLLGTLTLAILMLFIVCAFFSAVLAGYFVKIASFFTQTAINIIDKLASVPYSSLNSFQPNLIEIVLFYLSIYLLIKWLDERRRKKTDTDFSIHRLRALKYTLLLVIIFFSADITYHSLKDRFSRDLKVTVIDVGQGNSTLVSLPGGYHMLVDGGGFAESTFDCGKSVLSPFLHHQRINRIDTVVLSHPHPDHMMGLIYMMNNFNVRQLWKSVVPVDTAIFPQWGRAIRINDIKVSTLSNTSPETIINGVIIKILWPPDYSADKLQDLSFDEINDASLVLKITFGKISFLIPGDISAEVEKKLIKSGADLKSDVLVVPHHGSRLSSSPEFIKAVGCRYAIVSAGKFNIFRHPHPSVVQKYKDAGAVVLRTDMDGAITLTTDGNYLHKDTFIKDK
jgi:competence protein ComEC